MYVKKQGLVSNVVDYCRQFPSPHEGPVMLSHPCVTSTLASNKWALRKVKNGNQMPLAYIMGQAGGLFLVEFFWQRPMKDRDPFDKRRDCHVIAGVLQARKYSHVTVPLCP